MRRRGSRMLGKKLPPAEFGDGQLYVAGLGGQHPGPVPVALIYPLTRPLIALGADDRGHLALDELLADQADRFSDEVESFA